MFNKLLGISSTNSFSYKDDTFSETIIRSPNELGK